MAFSRWMSIRMAKQIQVTVILMLFLCSLFAEGFLKQAVHISIDQEAKGVSESPDGKWVFHMRTPSQGQENPTLWLRTSRNKKERFLGDLFRDGEVYWCPNSQCLILLDEHSVEDTRLKFFETSKARNGNVLMLDKEIRNKFYSQIHGRVLFYALDILGWIDDSHPVIAVQSRFVKPNTSAPAYVTTGGYVLNLKTKTIEQEIPAQDLKTKYGFNKNLV